jgi:HD-GYP domain-containing protein (c-di-GMP phosphodiesterase class II)
MSQFTINLHEAIFSLSHALDLVSIQEIHHGKRVAFITAECCKSLGWEKQRFDSLFQAAILHDCGVSKTSAHLELTQFESENEQEHCKAGAQLLKNTPPLAHLADYVYYHHTHWNHLKSLPLSEEVKISANCIYMADRVDVLTLGCLAKNPNILVSADEVREIIARKSGDFFHPSLVETFMEVSRPQAFWLIMEGKYISNYLAKWIENEPVKEIDFKDLKAIAQIFSHIVDTKSNFTKEHSEGVASLARYIGELFGLSKHTCDMLELAGLLHDLGKLRVPDELLEKNSKLTAEEYLRVQRHSFDTHDVLKNIKGFETIALWAAQHHERIDGSGYPYGHTKEQISFEARIIAVADVFQALAQNRPYRNALSPEQVLPILKEQVSDGKLDKNVVTMIESDLLRCWKTALLMN